jgi:hypothetical protein
LAFQELHHRGQRRWSQDSRPKREERSSNRDLPETRPQGTFERAHLRQTSGKLTANNSLLELTYEAFITFVNLHILFSAKAKSQDVLPAAQACPLVMPAEIQTKLGGALQAAVERYATDRSVAQDAEDEDAQAVADDDGELITA